MLACWLMISDLCHSRFSTFSSFFKLNLTLFACFVHLKIPQNECLSWTYIMQPSCANCTIKAVPLQFPVNIPQGPLSTRTARAGRDKCLSLQRDTAATAGYKLHRTVLTVWEASNMSWSHKMNFFEKSGELRTKQNSLVSGQQFIWRYFDFGEMEEDLVLHRNWGHVLLCVLGKETK